MDLKKGQHELLPLERHEVPAQVLEIVESDGNTITDMKRFRARNWRKKVRTGFAFTTDKGRTVLVEEGCEVYRHHGGFRGNSSMVPAYGVTVTSGTIADVVDGVFCHTNLRVSFAGYHVAVREPASASV